MKKKTPLPTVVSDLLKQCLAAAAAASASASASAAAATVATAAHKYA